MIFLLLLAQGILERGLLFCVVVLAVYLTSRIISFDDLTVEGSFGIGAAVLATTLVHGFSWPIGMFLAITAGR